MEKSVILGFSSYRGHMPRAAGIFLCNCSEQVQMRKQVLNTYRPAMILIPEEQYGDYSNMQKIRSVGDCLLLKTNYPANYPVHPDLCQLLTTSGSTGFAKYVRQSRENILCNASAIAGYLDIQAEDRSITTLPLQYTYSLSMLHAGFMRGASVVVTDLSVLDNDFWDLLEDEKVSMFHGVPGTYEFLDRMEMFSEDFPTVKTMTQAGEKLNRELYAEAFADHGIAADLSWNGGYDRPCLVFPAGSRGVSVCGTDPCRRRRPRIHGAGSV